MDVIIKGLSHREGIMLSNLIGRVGKLVEDEAKESVGGLREFREKMAVMAAQIAQANHDRDADGDPIHRPDSITITF